MKSTLIAPIKHGPAYFLRKIPDTSALIKTPKISNFPIKYLNYGEGGKIYIWTLHLDLTQLHVL